MKYLAWMVGIVKLNEYCYAVKTKNKKQNKKALPKKRNMVRHVHAPCTLLLCRFEASGQPPLMTEYSTCS